MASLASYFGLGRQSHRSLDDVRMNLQVLKCCSTVLLLEASPPESFPVVTNQLLELQGGGACPDRDEEVPNLEDEAKNCSSHNCPKRQRTTCGDEPAHDEAAAVQMMDPGSSSAVIIIPNNVVDEEMKHQDDARFLDPDDVSTEDIDISVALLSSSRYGSGLPRTVIRHRGAELRLRCADLRVRFGVSARFLSVTTGRPKLSVVVALPDNLGKVLEFCDELARTSSPEGVCTTSEWRPLVRKNGHMMNGSPTVRLNIPTVDEATCYATDIRRKERDGTTRKLAFGRVDAAELDSLLRWSKVDAFFSLEVYDYRQQNAAGIRLVANRLDVHSR